MAQQAQDRRIDQFFSGPGARADERRSIRANRARRTLGRPRLLRHVRGIKLRSGEVTRLSRSLSWSVGPHYRSTILLSVSGCLAMVLAQRIDPRPGRASDRNPLSRRKTSWKSVEFESFRPRYLRCCCH
jgi:hypothetical protein